MSFELTILGSSSATPTATRHPSAQVLNHNERLFLIDCGEATQIQMIRYKVKMHRINHVFISHLHGDHYLGLMGFISTLHLQGRSIPLHIYGPQDLETLIRLQLEYSDTTLRYSLEFHIIDNTEPKIIYEDSDISVETIILSHRIPCTGFVFRQKPQLRKIIREKILQYDIPVEAMSSIKQGADFTDENSGKIIPNSEITTEPSPVKSFAYCSDTIYDESLLPQIKGVNTLYHESTFMHDMLLRAQETYHTTCLQAGQLAKKAMVKQLIIGHFSARYSDLDPLLLEAQSAFANTTLAIEGNTYPIL